MAKKQIGSVPQIAYELVNHLPQAMDEELRKLIACAEEGQDTTIEIIDLLSEHEVTRRWLQEQVKRSSERSGLSGNMPLAGNSSPIPVTQRWRCPENICKQWMFVMQEGEDPPICQVHRVEMIRKGS